MQGGPGPADRGKVSALAVAEWAAATLAAAWLTWRLRAFGAAAAAVAIAPAFLLGTRASGRASARFFLRGLRAAACWSWGVTSRASALGPRASKAVALLFPACTPLLF